MRSRLDSVPTQVLSVCEGGGDPGNPAESTPDDQSECLFLI